MEATKSRLAGHLLFGLVWMTDRMKTRILIAALIAFALTCAACTNSQPAYLGTYPSDFEFGPNHGYEAYSSAPHDPDGAYYQNYAPATPYYYEPPESHRDCDQRPCLAYRRDAGAQPLEPEIIAVPENQGPLNPPSTISRSSHPGPPGSVPPKPESVD
jgi:hypothetical protein